MDIAESVKFNTVEFFKVFHQIVIDPQGLLKNYVVTPEGMQNYVRSI